MQEGEEMTEQNLDSTAKAIQGSASTASSTSSASSARDTQSTHLQEPAQGGTPEEAAASAAAAAAAQAHAQNARVSLAAAAAAAGAAAACGATGSTGSANCSCPPNQMQAPILDGTKSYKRWVMLAGFASVTTAVLLIVMKFTVWLLSGSSTILASLTDSLLDLGASFINLLALRFALRPADKDHRFGHYKAESLASLTQSAFICGSALFLIVHGYERLVNPQPLSYINIAIYVSIASIFFTLGLTWFQGFVCKITKSEAIAADRFHYLSDVLLNLSVIGALILSGFGYMWADGLITILLGLYIIRSSYHIGVTAIATLLDRSLGPDETTKIIRAIVAVPQVESFHDLRTRKAGPQYYIQCHIVLLHTMPLEQAHNVANEVEHNIRKDFPDADIMLHMEPDVADTFKDITFVDQHCCTVPAHYFPEGQAPTMHEDAHKVASVAKSAHDIVNQAAAPEAAAASTAAASAAATGAAAPDAAAPGASVQH